MTEHRVRVNLLGTAIILAAGIAVSAITSTVVAGRAMNAKIRTQAKVYQDITVKGSARLRVTSDIGVWRISVSSEHKELTSAFGLLEASVTAVQKFLAAKGFAAGEVALSAIETSQYYARDANGRETREIAGYNLSRSFTVTSGDVQRVARSAGEVTELLRDGVKVSSSLPQFSFTKLADLKVQILGDAAKDARTRAEEIVRNSGGRLGSLRDAQMGVMQITQPNSTEVAGYGLYDTSTIEKDVTAVVTVTFGVDN
jgi:hypothetical protein